jgi:hypothetical protein
MEDNEELNGKRPNARYELSNRGGSRTPDEGLTFHYNRERRLENAPDAVKNLYKEQKSNRISLFGPLVADKPRRVLFAIIILMSAVILGFTIFGFFDTSYTLGGNRIDITAAGFEDTAIVVLRKTGKKGAYYGAVDIAVSPVIQSSEEQYPVFYHRVFFSLADEEVYRFVVPFDNSELLMVLQSERETLQIRFKPE